MGSEMSKSSVPIVSCLFPVKVPGKLNHTEKENKRAKDKHWPEGSTIQQSWPSENITHPDDLPADGN